MHYISTYKDKKVLVLGLAKSGVSAAKILHKLGAIVTVNDYKSLNENPSAQELLAKGMRVITGSHPLELLEEDFFCMVKNPGIPYTNPMVEKALTQNLPILTEVELAFEISEAPIIGITGTNGKTTTTTMIAQILNDNRQSGKARLAGNIGCPASSVAAKANKDDELVMELSSFQLLGINKFKPEIAVITNIYSAHLDYHGSIGEYIKAKWRIQKEMVQSDFLIINADQEKLLALAASSKATVIPFSSKRQVAGAYLLGDTIYYQDEAIMKASELKIIGTHNLENALAAVAVAKLKGKSNEDIKKALQNFHGVKHRLQFVKKVAGRTFYNDSKATNILSTKQALCSFDNKKTILLAGGLDRGNGFDELVPDLVGLKALIVFGQTADKLKNAGQVAKIAQIYEAKNIEDAVQKAFYLSDINDNILLSPANASWDQYKNFEERGERFIAAIDLLELDNFKEVSKQ